MPWEVKKVGAEFCVVKQGTGEPIPGGCHPDERSALKHLRALWVAHRKRKSDG